MATKTMVNRRAAGKPFYGFRLLPSSEADEELGRFTRPYSGNYSGYECLIFTALEQIDRPLPAQYEEILMLPWIKNPGEAVDIITIRGWPSLKLEAGYRAKGFTVHSQTTGT